MKMPPIIFHPVPFQGRKANNFPEPTPRVPLPNLRRQVFLQTESALPTLLARKEGETIPVVIPTAAEIRHLKQAHFKRWLEQFAPSERRTALLFLEKLRIIGPTELNFHLQQAHQKLIGAMAFDGFAGDLSKTDFTTLYQASSGDLITYHYRKTNRIPKVHFHDQAALASNGQNKSDRALVILDDYLATGAQFFCEALGHGKTLPHDQNRHIADLVSQYQQVYFVVAGVHTKALKRFELIEAGKTEEAISEILEGYKEKGNPVYEIPIRKVLGTIPAGKIKLLYSFVEHPLLSPDNPRVNAEERQRLRAFLQKHNVYKYPFGVGGLQGNTVFYYSAPNNLPDMLWNTKSRRLRPDGSQDKTVHWQPLFHRLEDVSAYWYAHAHKLPAEQQLW